MFRKRKNKEKQGLLISYEKDYISPMEEMGFTFYGNIEHKYVHVYLPDGWYSKLRNSEGIKYTYLYDEKGRLRAECVVGNRGGDHTTFLCCYRVFYDTFKEKGLTFNRYVVVKEYDIPYPPFLFNDYKHMHKFICQSSIPSLGKPNISDVLTWLAENYPDYENPFAYWD